jgi:predicted RNA-binding Zn-ribbon protein involved in translation (DUF1610 family)
MADTAANIHQTVSTIPTVLETLMRRTVQPMDKASAFKVAQGGTAISPLNGTETVARDVWRCRSCRKTKDLFICSCDLLIQHQKP